MKTARVYLLAVMLLSLTVAQAQSWASPQATWYYEHKWFFYGRIVEDIGNLWYIFPLQGCISDVDEGSSLKCVNNNGVNHQFSAQRCDYISSVYDQYEPMKGIEVYPNPASTSFGLKNIDLGQSYNFELHSPDGKLIQSLTINEDTYSFDMEKYEAGIYLVTVTNGKGQRKVMKLLKK